MRMCACMHAVPMKFRRGHQILWVWSFLWLRTASFGFWELNWDPLGTEPRAAAIFTSWEDHLSSLHQKAFRSNSPLLDCSYTTTVVWGQDCHTSIPLFSSDNPLMHFPVWLRGTFLCDFNIAVFIREWTNTASSARVSSFFGAHFL